MSKKKERLVLHEYLIEYDFINDFFDIWKRARESYMYLNELKNIYFNSLEIEKLAGSSKDYRKNLKRRILDILQEYEELDKDTLQNSNSVKIENGKIIWEEENKKESSYDNLKYILDKGIDFILLTERIDKIQDEILIHLCEVYGVIAEKTSEKDEALGIDYIAGLNNALLYSYFSIHTDLDRIDTVKLYTNDRAVLKYFKEDELPYFLKVINYDYVLKKRRALFKGYSKFVIDLIKAKATNDEKIALEKYNRSIKILTIISITISLIGLLMA